MMRHLGWVLASILLAGIVHIVTVFGIPHFAVADPWSSIEERTVPGMFIRLPREGPGVHSLPGLDPALAHSVCRFGLEDGPVRIKATMPHGYWSLSLYDRQGLHAYGLDNRAAGQKPIDVLIASTAQVSQLRENPPEEFEDAVIVEWKGREGFALLEALVPQPSEASIVDTALATATCATTALP